MRKRPGTQILFGAKAFSSTPSRAKVSVNQRNQRLKTFASLCLRGKEKIRAIDALRHPRVLLAWLEQGTHLNHKKLSVLDSVNQKRYHFELRFVLKRHSSCAFWGYFNNLWGLCLPCVALAK
jgi:hypothetical protein